MIILRQKEHSSKLMKVVRTMKRAGNNVVTAIDNAGLKVGNTAKEIITGKPTPAFKTVKFRPKTSQQINRETVQQVRGVEKSAKEIKEAAMKDPEGMAGRLTGAAAKKVTTAPLSTAGKAIVDVNYPGVPTTTPYLSVAPIEQKMWDRVNGVGVGNYTLGRVTKPLKNTIRNNAESFGRALYRQGTLL